MTEVNHREESSGNIFADLNIPEPSLYLAKAQLANQIVTVIRERNLTQVEAADILGINQPKVSALTRGNLDGFKCDRLFKFLNLLGQDIEIVIRPQKSRKSRSRNQGQLRPLNAVINYARGKT